MRSATVAWNRYTTARISVGVVRGQPGFDQLPHALGSDHLVAGLAREELELPAAIVGMARDERDRAGRVADLLDPARQRRHVAGELDVEHQPVLVEALVDERDTELLADRARRAVGRDQPAGAMAGDGAVGRRRGDLDHIGGLIDRPGVVAEPQFDAGGQCGITQERLEHGLVVGDGRVMAERPVRAGRHLDTDDPPAIGARRTRRRPSAW